MKISTAYFSATNTTKAIVTAIAKELGTEVTHYNITNNHLHEEIEIAPEDVLLVGMPVYAGRIPALAVDSLKQFKGRHTPVILVAVYGNRAVDDAFVEMQDLFEARGFFVMAAGSFIAQHSIFPKTAKGRPDASDFQKIKEFSQHCLKNLQQGISADARSVSLPGNRPYKTPGSIPLKVVTSSRCKECGACIKACPAGAIPADNPHVTDFEKCIHCARCIQICQEHARHFDGLLYKVAAWKFGRKCKVRLEPEFYF